MRTPMGQKTAPLGVPLTNLGTPDSPNVAEVRRYLKEFLSDRRVVSMPRLIWWPLLNFVILNRRPKQSAKSYQKIWTKQGSPLLTMRYGNPSITARIDSLKQKGVRCIVVLPLISAVFSYDYQFNGRCGDSCPEIRSIASGDSFYQALLRSPGLYSGVSR